MAHHRLGQQEPLAALVVVEAHYLLGQLLALLGKETMVVYMFQRVIAGLVVVGLEQSDKTVGLAGLVAAEVQVLQVLLTVLLQLTLAAVVELAIPLPVR